MNLVFLSLLTGLFLFQGTVVLSNRSFYRRRSSDPAHRYAAKRSTLALVYVILTFLLTWGWALLFTSVLNLGSGWVGLWAGAMAYLLSSVAVFLPLHWWATFGVEASEGFNRMGKALFFLDQLRSLGLWAVLVSLVLFLAWGLWVWSGSGFFYAVPPLALVLVLVFDVLFPQLIVPLFNKLTPLPPGELRTRLEALAQRTELNTDQIFVMDAEKRSSHANAWVAGLGPFRRIVLFDTLVKDFPPEEVEAVLAHEVGHARRHHLSFSLVISGVGLVLAGALAAAFWACPGIFFTPAPSREAFLFACFFLFPGLTFPLRFPLSALSRRNEFQADAYARDLGYGQALASALQRLEKNSRGVAKPPAWARWLSSHPTVEERSARLAGVRP